MITYLGILVSGLSALVAGLICWQVFSLIKLERYSKEIKLAVEESIKKSMKDYNNTISAIIHQLNGILHSGLIEKDIHIALDSFIEAINDLNNATNKEPLVGIVSYIEDLVSENRNLFKLSNSTKNKYLEICKKCSESKKLVELLSQNQSNVTGDNIQGVNVNVNK